MLFNSYAFLLFLTIVLAVRYAPLPWSGKKVFLIAAGYFFYAAWNPPFVLLLGFTTLLDWFVSLGIHRAPTQARKKSLLVASLVVNLGLLAVFKYGKFALTNFVSIAAFAGLPLHVTIPNIVLPVGISFYTFQSMAYAIDVYRGKMAPATKFLDYALFVSFFPQLVAGPIMRADQFLPQASEEPKTNPSQVAWGLSLMVLGLFQKMALADGILAPIVDRGYDQAAALDPLSAWAATFAFASQIFFDFAGYSTCAIGVALMLGFHIPDNFRFPYASLGFSDFWRRWHISLSTWLRDYLYVPLGGNRAGPSRTYINLMLTMLLGGLWHGASWNFVVWGGLHGLYLGVERILRERFGSVTLFETRPSRFLLGLFTFLLVCVTWVFFRATRLDRALQIVSAMLGQVPAGRLEHLTMLQIQQAFALTAVLLLVHTAMREKTLEQLAAKTPTWARGVAIASMLVCIVFMAGRDRAFIYFQF